MAIPYLPAGLELFRGARNLIPNSNLCIGGLPKEIEENAGIIFYIDQITTGKHLLKDLNHLKDKKIDTRRIRAVSYTHLTLPTNREV